MSPESSSGFPQQREEVRAPAEALRPEPARALGSGPGPSAPLPRGLRLRLTVAIPLVVTFLVMTSGFVTLWISYPLFFQAARPTPIAEVEQRVVWAILSVGVLALVSLPIAIGLAYSIVRPLRALTSRIETLRRGAHEGAARRVEATEIAALGSALEGVVSAFPDLILDSYTLRSLEGGVVTLDQDGIVTSFNAVAEQVLGGQASRVVGRLLTDVVPNEPPNREFLQAVRAARTAGSRASSAETTIRTRSGRTIQLGYSLSPLRDEHDRSLGIVLTFKDLAERKHAEQLMRRTENLAVLGSIAAGLAHQFRTPLGSMRGLAELIREDLPPESPQRAYPDQMLASIDRLDHLTRELLTVGNPAPRTIEPLDLNDVARRALNLCRYDTGQKTVEVQESYAAGLPPVPGDAERLYQAFLNLLRNAFEAVNDGGCVAVTTSRAAEGVRATVRNTGSYVPPEEQEKLFTPFHTTKRKGSGLGLAIAHQVVRAHGGRLAVASDPEQGTLFTVELPLAGPHAVQEG